MSAEIPKATEPASTPSSTPPVEPKPPTANRVRGLVLLGILVVGVVAAWPIVHKWLTHESTDDAFIEAHVVQIAPQVAGRVARVFVDDNQEVTSGTLLCELDPADYEVAVARARAALELAQAQTEQARAAVAAAQANVGQAEAAVLVAQATAENAEADLQRYENLYRTQSISEQTLLTARTQERVTKAQVEQAKKQLTAAQAQVETARAALLAAQAQENVARTQLAKAELDLSYTHVRAPMDGRVTKKNVEPGQFLAVGQPILALVGRDRWVVANFKETQLAHMKPGQPVKIRIDAMPGQSFAGKVDSIQAGTGSRFSLLPAENATGNFVKVVQRVPVKIVFDPPLVPEIAGRLGAGMSVVPQVKVK
ncbi:MAG: HlyD family secretion protein [Candidatus Sumerlaea chitinivorans]|nr:HlyD family secretion protein [Candidatus Sumerlaea chitinivorans]